MGATVNAAFGTTAQGRDFEKLLPLRVPHETRGLNLLHDPLFNKGTAHSTSERERLGLRGLLPPRVETMEEQVARVMANLAEQPDDIRKAVVLNELHDRNETLFHRCLVSHITELAPVVYTPTVGQVCVEYGDNFRRPRGMYFSAKDRGCFASMMYNWPQRDVHICVVTDGSRILGLGDLGVNGMGIPVGKLALYCAAGGIAPHRVMPVVLDVGTDRRELVEDPNYLGLKTPRLKGDELYEVVDEFMVAMKHHFPRALVQFEDFSSDHAATILEKYRHHTLCFNDDIQGTGCVALAGLLSAMRAQGKPAEALKDQRILVAGAGSAGLGVANMLVQGMVQQGLTEAEARSRFYICDKDGLLTSGRDPSTVDKAALPFLRQDASPLAEARKAGELREGMSLEEVAAVGKPTVLLGLSAVGGLFSQALVQGVQAAAEESGGSAVIFPLSNPTHKAECTAAQAYEWTNGKCVFASGSPFDPVEGPDGKTFIPSQCNNMFIFPGLGLGATVCGASVVTDQTLYASALSLAGCLTDEERAAGQVFPSVNRIRGVSEDVAHSVMMSSAEQGVASRVDASWSADQMRVFLRRKTYDPFYVPLGIDPYHQ